MKRRSIIDFRCRPSTPDFCAYFDRPRVEWLARRVGARSLSPAFLRGSMELFWQEMDEAGIEIGVVLGRNSPAVFMGKPFKEAFIANEKIAELQKRYPGRLVGFGGIDASNTVHNAAKETLHCIDELTLGGIFIEPGRQLLSHPNDDRLLGVYEICVDRNVPVVIMSGPYAGADIAASHPVYIDQLATRLPSLKIVIGHGAWPWIDEMLGVAFKHANVYVSPDLYFFAPGGDRLAAAVGGVLRDQFLFATAYPLRPLAQTVEDCEKFPIDDECAATFFRDNALTLLPTIRAVR
jgi:predicted TIM-barrel fold metal-dependent hydrolase